MLSKEEIEKAKGWLSALDIKSEFEAIWKEIILQYIDQLEGYLERISKQLDNVAIDQIPIGITELQQENNKLNKIIDEMVEQLTTLALWDNQDKKVVLIKANQDIRQYFEKKVGGK